MLTLEDVKAMKGEVITPAVAAEILGADPHWLRIAARTRPELLGFSVIVMGSRVKIPRRAFVKFMEGDAVDGCA